MIRMLPRIAWVVGLSMLSLAPVRAQDFDAATYRARRDRLSAAAREGVVIVQGVTQDQPGLTEYLIDDSDNHDFLYLTGVETKTATLVLLPQSTTVPEILFVPEDEIARAQATSGVKTVMPVGKLSDVLSEALTDYSMKRLTERRHKLVSTEMARVLSLTPRKVFYLNYPRYVNLAAEPPARVALGERLRLFSSDVELRDDTPLLTRLRMRHDATELAMITKAVHMGALGLMAAMKASKPGAFDYQVDAVAEATFKQEGASRIAYPPLTYISPFGRPVQALSAAQLGKSSEPQSAIHQMQAGDLVMLDAGGEYHHYATDLSRMVPIGGKFTPEQRQLYDAVVAAHHAAIAAIRPGATFQQVHDAAVAELKKKNLDAMFTFGTSHLIGMDAHDPGDYEKPLEAGMILTVEPGFIDNQRNITVHVEDMVLVTDNGHQVLSDAVPIEAADVERMLATK